MPWIVSSIAVAVVAFAGVVAWMAMNSSSPTTDTDLPTAIGPVAPVPSANGPATVEDVLGTNAGAAAEASLKQFVLEGR